MILDALVVWGLNVYDKKLKAEKEAAAAEADVQHETEKKATRATKAANRAQRKAEQKKTQNTNGQASFAPKQHIQQPDKNKKLR